MNRIATHSIIAIACLVFNSCSSNKLEGKWQYDGGVYNGKPKEASPDFVMQRTYTNDSYEAYVLEAGREGEKYAGGTYKIKGDSLYLTGTFSSQSSQLMGVTQVYHFSIDGKKLTTRGILPNGMQVEEYWKKVQ